MRLILMALLLMVVRSAAAQDGGVIGATCWSEPSCPQCEGSDNACQTVEKTFYAGVTMLLAKDAMIAECQKRNAIDYCGAFCPGIEAKEKVIASHGGGCFAQCSTKTVCLYGDNM